MKNAPSIKLAVLVAVLSGSICFPQKRIGSDAESARSFIEHVYAQYGPTGNPASLFEENARKVFDPSLIALFRSDVKAARPDVGALDYDPICNCQDPDDSLRDLKILVQPVDENRATATVTFSGYNHQLNKIALTLLRKKSHWLIFNIEDLSGPGSHTDLRSILKADIQKLSSKQK